MRFDLLTLAALIGGLTACTLGVTSTAGVTLDSAGHIGLLAQAGPSVALDLSDFRDQPQTHGSFAFVAYDLGLGYDITGRRALALFDLRLRATVLSDPWRLGISPSAGVRVGGWFGGPAFFGPLVGIDVLPVISAREKSSCGSTSYRHHLAGGSLEGAWFPLEERPSVGMLTLGGSHMYHATWSLCPSGTTADRSTSPSPSTPSSP